jgi:hypothetical protein
MRGLVTTALFLVLTVATVLAQGTSPSTRVPSRLPLVPLYRAERPLAFACDFATGVGVEYTLADFVTVAASTRFTEHAASLRLYAIGENNAPFVAFEYGHAASDPARSVVGDWSRVMVGFEYAKGVGFLRVHLGYTISQQEGLERPMFSPSFAFGLRF